jgi:18S rRNA (adenine1779-N6/adenine1780-N6)-dimethyltransferase
MRLVAKPGSEFYCRLSVNVQLLARVDHLMKVSKKNFCPPPKVESSVVRIEPRHPLPNINFTEWDGLLRICFSRKNKTLGAIFKQKAILELLYKNYKTLNRNENTVMKDDSNFETMKIDAEALGRDEEEMVNDEEEIDEEKIDEEKKSKNPGLEDFKAKLITILSEGKYNENRATKMDIDNFLFLLNMFNNNGIHFK